MFRHRLCEQPRRRRCSPAVRRLLPLSCIGSAKESRDSPLRCLCLESVPLVRKTLSGVLTRRGGGDGGAFAVRGVYEIFELFARLEEGDLLRGHFHFFPCFGVAPHSAAALASAEAAKAANLNFFAFLEGADYAVENSFDDRFGFLARELRYAQNLFNEVGLGQCGLLGHRPVASSPCLR